MSDNTEQSPGPSAGDADAWATACAEDLAGERARRRERYGPPPADLGEELRKLADAVTEGLGRLGVPAGLLAEQARAAAGPVLERNAEALGHLARAGEELIAAYRATVTSHERAWARPDQPETESRTEPGSQGKTADIPGENGDTGASGGAHRIDLD